MGDPNGAVLTRCPGEGCKELVRPRLFRTYLDEASWKRWQEYSARRYASEASTVSFCPAPDCQYAVVVRDAADLDDHEVVCGAGHAPFCFRCKKPAHKPASCAEIAKWDQEFSDGSASYVRDNCKMCPKCATMIERSTGCNKVICTRCGTAFCWMCGNNFLSAHNYPQEAWECNKPPAVVKLGDKASELARLSFFSKRVESCADSARMARELTEQAMWKLHLQQLQAVLAKQLGVLHSVSDEVLDSIWRSATSAASASSSSSSGSAGGGDAGALGSIGGPGRGQKYADEIKDDITDAKWLHDAIQTAAEGRTLLRYGYIHAFFIQNEAEQALFTEQMSHLEATVERLQQLTESTALVNLRLGAPVLGLGISKTKTVVKAPEEPRGPEAGHVGRWTYDPAMDAAKAAAGAADGASSSGPSKPADMDDKTLPLPVRFQDWKMRVFSAANAAAKYQTQLSEGAAHGLLMEEEYLMAESIRDAQAQGSSSGHGASGWYGSGSGGGFGSGAGAGASAGAGGSRSSAHRADEASFDFGNDDNEDDQDDASMGDREHGGKRGGRAAGAGGRAKSSGHADACRCGPSCGGCSCDCHRDESTRCSSDSGGSGGAASSGAAGAGDASGASGGLLASFGSMLRGTVAAISGAVGAAAGAAGGAGASSSSGAWTGSGDAPPAGARPARGVDDVAAAGADEDEFRYDSEDEAQADEEDEDGAARHDMAMQVEDLADAPAAAGAGAAAAGGPGGQGAAGGGQGRHGQPAASQDDEPGDEYVYSDDGDE